MPDYRCKICGGNLEISINSELAKCENCGNTVEIDSSELIQLRKTYESAGRKIRMNSVNSLSEAIDQFQMISFVSEAREKIPFCEKRIKEIEAAKEKRRINQVVTEKSNEKLGVFLLIMFLLIAIVVIAGAVFVIYGISKGTLTQKQLVIVISITAVLIITAIIGKLNS